MSFTVNQQPKGSSYSLKDDRLEIAIIKEVSGSGAAKQIAAALNLTTQEQRSNWIQDVFAGKVGSAGKLARCLLTLHHPGDRKLEVIKLLRDGLDLPLKECLQMVEQVPTTLSFVSRTEARRLKRDLEQAGATVQM